MQRDKEQLKNNKSSDFLVFILIGVAGVTAYIALKDKNSDAKVTPTELHSVGVSMGTSPTELPSEIKTKAPILAPTAYPSFEPSMPVSNEPNSFPTRIPSAAPTQTPTPPITTSTSSPSMSPSAKATFGCVGWCAGHPEAWSTKCKWSENCGGCPHCDSLDTLAPSSSPVQNTCKNWCYPNTSPWYDPNPLAPQKCRYPKNCAGCPECSDPNIFPPAANGQN